MLMNAAKLDLMEQQSFHLIVLGVGSEISDTIQYTTRGKAFEYFHLLCKRGGSYDEFMLNCRGGTINDKAKEVTKAVLSQGRDRDALRSTVTKMIVNAISKISIRTLLFTTNADRQSRQVGPEAVDSRPTTGYTICC
jgi:hypothetical protein